ncbi:MAG: DUF7133 domain-containing protein [Akkermansiaceae bacterium]
MNKYLAPTLATCLAALALAPTSLQALPPELEQTTLAGSDLTPSPACLSAHPNGDVFVGVDMCGSLGKGPGKGKIVRLRDTDNDGVADEHTIFATLDNPRGLIAVGDKVYVIYTIWKDEKTFGAMHLGVLEDKDKDGKADGPPKILVSDISCKAHNQSRGADHTTNGMRMGIDGWIYVAVGDYGMHEATGTDGNKLTMLGGGIVRVRPDGSELEVYTLGLRNIYDVAVDPFMNIYTRGNTNDGGGWNVRFIHNIQSGQYGYPMLFKNFTDEIIPALADLGGGSGTGAMFFQEPGWPEKYNNVPLMGDWGRSHVYIHRLQPDGPTFTQEQEDYIGLTQFTDIDSDASGRLYLASWAGAGFKGSAEKGHVVRVVPKGWTHTPAPKFRELADDALVKLLRSPSATIRLHTQQEILDREASIAPAVLAIAADTTASAESRVAAIFTYAQLLGEKAKNDLHNLSNDASIREFALRAMTDRKPHSANTPLQPLLAGLGDENPRVQVAAAVGLGRITPSAETAKSLVKNAVPPAVITIDNSAIPHDPKRARDCGCPKCHQGGPHDIPNSAIVFPHVIVQSLVSLNAIDECLSAIDGPGQNGALWALRRMHDPKTVDGLIAKLGNTSDAELKNKILTALARLYHKEEPYDGSWWWFTRPDTRGPYYKPIKWSESGKIEQVYRAHWDKADAQQKAFLSATADKHRMNLSGIGKAKPAQTAKKSNKGQVGKTAIEDVMVALDKMKGNPKAGKKALESLACIGCHNINPDDPVKATDFAKMGSRMSKDQIAEAILKPDATIADSWVTVTTNDGTPHMGTLISKDDTKVVVNNIAGIGTTLAASDVKSIEKQTSTLMGPGLANDLSLQEFVDMVSYLHSLK